MKTLDLKNVKNLVIKFPSPIIKGLVFSHVAQNWKPVNGKKAFYIETLVNYPDAWRVFFHHLV